MITRAEKMRMLHESGRTQEAIAAAFGCSRNAVRYAIDDEYRAVHRQRVAEQNRRRRAARGLKPVGFQPKKPDPMESAPVYDGGSVWIEDRSVWSCGPSKRFGYKCAGGGGKQEPKPERAKPKPDHRPACIRAVDRHFAGDADALAEYLRQVGRESLAVGSIAE